MLHEETVFMNKNKQIAFCLLNTLVIRCADTHGVLRIVNADVFVLAADCFFYVAPVEIPGFGLARAHDNAYHEMGNPFKNSLRPNGGCLLIVSVMH
jgi:hypothetical protein